jgi:tRNA-2-methylthio-N6-dimethylallyladenosine synthase
MEDDVNLDEKKERLNILQSKLNNYSSQISRKMVGTIERCLVIDISKRNPGEFQARTENNRVVNFSSTQNFIGSFIDLEIVEAKPNSLRGNFSGGTIN